jgi:hypothetical protein
MMFCYEKKTLIELQEKWWRKEIKFIQTGVGRTSRLHRMTEER